MTQRFSRTLLLAGVCALIAPLSWGAAPERKAKGLSLTRLALNAGPDFVIRKLNAPPSAWPGGPLPVTITVCNQGTEGASTPVEIVLSSDPVVSQDDAVIVSEYLGWLPPGQCATDTYYALASVPSGAWHVGGIADRYDNTVESDETNNTWTGPLMGIGWAPDIVIPEVRAPASVTPGQTFTASVRVCNQGTQPLHGGAEVLLVLSEDPDIRFSYDDPPQGQDLPVMSFQTVPLGAGQCKTQQVSLDSQPPHEGAWYLGAVADPHHYEPELITTNNTRASELFGIGYQADFRIESVKGPASVTPGQMFTAAVKVCNQGTMHGSTDVHLVLSQDSTIMFDPELPPEEQDQPLSSFPTGPLAPGQCKTQQVQASAQVQRYGPWYLGAVADPFEYEPELIETNNTRASEPIGIGYGSDFTIASVSAPPNIAPGDTVTISVKVCNQGTTSDSADVLLVLSEDTDIRFSYSNPHSEDLPLQFFHSGTLSAGQCKTHQVETQVSPPSFGSWYLGAIADPDDTTQELVETNNTRASALTGIGYGADYVIREISAPASITPGQPFTASVTVCNQGTTSGHVDVLLVLSEDTDIRFSYDSPPESQDLPVESFFVPYPLQPGQCMTQQVQTSIHVPWEGPWYLGAVADPSQSSTELLKDNNTLASDAIGIGYLTDYVIREVRGPASVTPGQQFTASVTVCNQGTVNGSTDVQLVLSEDTDISFSYESPPYDQDPPLGSFHTGPLVAGQCRTQQVELSAWAPHDGVWYLGAVADPGHYHPELIETNNTRASNPMGIGFQPDFVIPSVSVPASVTPGQDFTASVTVCNRGTVGGSTEVQLVLSEDTDILFSYNNPPHGQDLPLDNFYTGPLAAGQCRTQQVELSAWAPHNGVWYLGAVADPGDSDQEFLETNNSRASNPMGIGFQPDFVIPSVSVPASITPGQDFTASVTVCNQGTVGGGTEVQLVLSEDTDILFSYNNPPHGQDLPLGIFYTGPLAAGQCRTQQVELSAWAPENGIWYVGAVATPGDSAQEFLETNNSRASAAVGIGYFPDYRIESVSSPPNVRPGDPLTLEVTVCNRGTVSGGTDVHVVLSEDTEIGSGDSSPPYQGDIPLEYFSTGMLEAGQCLTQQVQTSAWAPHEGLWHFGAVADPGNSEQEFLETNNTGVSEAVGVGFYTDYRIQSVIGPPSVRPGDPLTLEVTVCNQGTVDGSTEVVLVLSEDPDIRFSYSGPPSGQDLALHAHATGPLAAGECQTQQVETLAWSPHNGAWYLGAVADPGNTDQESLENNNTLAGNLMGIGYDADIVIQELTAPSVTAGQPYEVTVTVCNQGTASSSADVQLVLSEDPDIRFSYSGPSEQQDLPVEFLSFSSLEQGQCVTQNVTLSMTFPGASSWYVGAVADPSNSLQELIETNNTRASGAVRP